MQEIADSLMFLTIPHLDLSEVTIDVIEICAQKSYVLVVTFPSVLQAK